MRDTRIAFLAFVGIVVGIVVALPWGTSPDGSALFVGPSHLGLGMAIETMTLIAIVILTNTI